MFTENVPRKPNRLENFFSHFADFKFLFGPATGFFNLFNP